MNFVEIFGKLGNMRKAVEWVVVPRQHESHLVTIQAEKRIALVNLTTGKAILSDGKNGHQGFMKLSKAFGAYEVDCPAEMLEQLKTKELPTGPQIIS